MVGTFAPQFYSDQHSVPENIALYYFLVEYMVGFNQGINFVNQHMFSCSIKLRKVFHLVIPVEI